MVECPAQTSDSAGKATCKWTDIWGGLLGCGEKIGSAAFSGVSKLLLNLAAGAGGAPAKNEGEIRISSPGRSGSPPQIVPGFVSTGERVSGSWRLKV